MSQVPRVKVEQSAMSTEPSIKPDPGQGASPSVLSEDDIYEDAGDLEFPKGDQEVYLMKLPRFLWDNWSKIKDDEEIKLGTVRVANQTDTEPQKLTLLLASDLKENKGLPKEYDMVITNAASNNTFVFSEKDLPGYESKSKTKANAANLNLPPIPSRLLQPDRDRDGSRPRWEPGKRWGPYYRKAVPKQTAIAGVVKHEVNCNPVENAEYAQLVAERAKQASKPKRGTVMLEGDISTMAGNLLQPGTLGKGGDFRSFIKTGQTATKKGQDQRAARIPLNELLDLIFACFKRYNYWSMKALRAELNQPEPYLKSTLEQVAELVKTGRFAMTWTLKPENKQNIYEQADEQAPDSAMKYDSASEGADLSMKSDDDEENVKMEDVLPA